MQMRRPGATLNEQQRAGPRPRPSLPATADDRSFAGTAAVADAALTRGGTLALTGARRRGPLPGICYRPLRGASAEPAVPATAAVRHCSPTRLDARSPLATWPLHTRSRRGVHCVMCWRQLLQSRMADQNNGGAPGAALQVDRGHQPGHHAQAMAAMTAPVEGMALG